MRDSTVKRWSSIHKMLFRATRGRVGKRLADNDMLLLTTVGARTGVAHTVPLLYLRADDSLIVIASYGGRSHHPDWYLNLAENPEVVVQILGDRSKRHARTATDSEREQWWPQIVEAYDGYFEYQKRTERVIPIVSLDLI